MTVGSVLIGLALLVLILTTVVRPLVRPGAAATSPVSGGSPRLEPVLAALRDLDFDHRMGQVTDQDYAPTRAGLLAQAARAMAQGAAPSMDDALEERVREIRRHLPDAPRAEHCTACGNRLRSGDRFCSRCGRPHQAACPSCAAAIAPGDAYCSTCGQRLEPEGISAPGR